MFSIYGTLCIIEFQLTFFNISEIKALIKCLEKINRDMPFSDSDNQFVISKKKNTNHTVKIRMPNRGRYVANKQFNIGRFVLKILSQKKKRKTNKKKTLL